MTRDDGAVTFTLDRARSGARATALRAVWTQGEAMEDDGARLIVRDGDARVRVRRRATATAVREGTYVCVRGEPARASDGEVELANAVVAAAEAKGEEMDAVEAVAMEDEEMVDTAPPKERLSSLSKL